MEFSINSQEQSKSYRRLIHELTSSLRKREWSADVQRFVPSIYLPIDVRLTAWNSEEFTIKAMLEMARNNAEAMREKMRRPSPEVPLPASMQDRNSEKKRSKPLRPAPTRTMTTRRRVLYSMISSSSCSQSNSRRAAKRVDYADISEDDSAVSSRNPDRSARPSRAQSLNPEEVYVFLSIAAQQRYNGLTSSVESWYILQMALALYILRMATSGVLIPANS